MKKRISRFILAFTFPCIIFAMTFTSRSFVDVRNPATSDGTISFRFTPQGGIAKIITVNIKNGWNAQRISREIADKLTNEMPSNYRATSRTRGIINYVDVEKDSGHAANFELLKTGMTAQGVSVVVTNAP